MRTLARACAAIALLAISRVQAASPTGDCAPESGDCVPEGQWNFSLGMGVGFRTNPVSNHDIPTVFIPQFSYYGRRLFIDNLDVGYSIISDDRNTVSLLATPAYDRQFFNDSDIQDIFLGGGLTAVTPSSKSFLRDAADPIARRPNNLMYLAGAEWAGRYGVLTTRLDLLYDASVKAGGGQVRGSVAFPLTAMLGGSWDANLGVTWNSQRYSAYFYHIGQNTFDPYLTATYSRPLAHRWRFNTLAEYERIGAGASENGRLAHNYVVTVFMGVFHDF